MRYKGLRVERRRRPTIEKRTVTPRRPTNAAVRPREYLTGEEVKRLMETARSRPGRNGHRDATMILIAYRHGLRVSELVAIRWDMLDLKRGTFHVVRRKNGRPSVHLIRGDEIRALRRVEREQISGSPYVFVTNLLRTSLTSGGRATMFGPWTHETFAASAAPRRRSCGDARSS